jgi:hypothetical protein
MINFSKIKISLVLKKKIGNYNKIQEQIRYHQIFIKKKYFQNKILQNRLQGQWDRD